MAPRLKISETQPKEHHLTMEKQPKPQRRVGSDERSCRARRFPWACRLRVLLILLLLHFLLLHLPATRSLAAGGARWPVASAVQRGAPDERGLGFFPAVPEARRAATELTSLRHHSIPATPAHRDGHRTGMLLHPLKMHFLFSVAWKQAILGYGRHKHSASASRTHLGRHRRSAAIRGRTCLLSGRWKK